MSEQPMNDIPQTNYLKVNGRLFSLTEVANEQVDVEAELKEYYNEQYLKHVSRFNGGVIGGLTTDWDAQLQKLRDYRERGSVTIPSGMRGVPVITLDGSSVEEVRAILYSPNVWKMTRYDLAGYIGARRQTSRDEDGIESIHYAKKKTATDLEIDLNTYTDDQVLIVTTERINPKVAVYSLNTRSDRLSCYNLNTFHSQGNSICTGGHRASAFWNNSDFEGLMNQVNHFSLGSRSVYYRGRSSVEREQHGLNDYVNLTTILSVEPERRDDAWTTT